MRLWGTCLLLALLLLPAGGCGGRSRHANQPGLVPRDSELSDEAQQLVASLGLEQGSTGPAQARQVSANDYVLDGAQFASRTGYPTVISPQDPTSLRLTTSAAHQTALAIYQVEAAGTTFDTLPKRLDIDVRAVTGSPADLQYFIGISDFTSTRWRWRGPFPAAPYSMLLNTADVRDRYFDLSGNTLVAIALHSKQTAAIEVRSLAYSTAGTYFPVKPYRAGLSTGRLFPRTGYSSHYPKSGPVVHLARNWVDVYNTPTYPAPYTDFDWLGYRHLTLYRVQPDGSLLLIGRNVADQTPLEGAVPLPGVAYDYCVALENDQGSSPPSDPIAVRTYLYQPAVTQAEPSSDSVTLAWDLQAGTDKYELLRDGETVANVTEAKGVYADSTAEPGIVHSYEVVAYSAGQPNSSAPARAMRWAVPGYFVGGGGEDGQLVALAAGPAMLTGATFGSTVWFSFIESETTLPRSAADWQWKSSTSFPGLQGSLPQGPLGVNAAFASYHGQPACALHSVFASWMDFDLAIVYRQDPGLPPLPPNLLQYRGTWAPTDSFAIQVSLHEINGRLAATWRSEYTLCFWFAYCPQFQPESGANWQVSRVHNGSAYTGDLTELGSSPAMLIDGKYYRTPLVMPQGPADWTSYAFPGVANGSIENIGGRLWVLYSSDAGYGYYRADVAEPQSIADWTQGYLPLSIPPAGERGVRLAAWGGRAAVTAKGGDGILYLLVSDSGAAPGEPAQWTVTPLEYGAKSANLVDSGGNLIVAALVDSDLRPRGYYMHYLEQ